MIPEGFATVLLFIAVGGPFVCFFLAVLYDFAVWRTGHRAEAVVRKEKRRKRRVTLSRARAKSTAYVRLTQPHGYDDTVDNSDNSDASVVPLDQPEAKQGTPDGQAHPGAEVVTGCLDAPETKKHDDSLCGTSSTMYANGKGAKPTEQTGDCDSFWKEVTLKESSMPPGGGNDSDDDMRESLGIARSPKASTTIVI